MSSKIILVTGGSRGGKSSYAESLYEGNDEVLYIATAIAVDPEMENRINLHRVSRNQSWETVEAFKDLDQVIAKSSKKDILLDCVTIMVTNLMFDHEANIEDCSLEEIQDLETRIIKEFKHLIRQVREQEKNIILVTNEVGYGLVPEYKLGRIFRDMAGRVNQQIARLSDEVYLVSCGLPLKLK